jgi:hypothetical protein
LSKYVEGTTVKRRRRNHRTYEEDDAGFNERHHGMERKEENAGVRESDSMKRSAVFQRGTLMPTDHCR